MRVAKAPLNVSARDRGFTIFLAGSIEMGAAPNWQERIERALADYDGTILNPRRDDWDASWAQSIENPQFHEQVSWELDGLRDADLVVVYFAPDTKSPITLLELGLLTNRCNKAIVCCPEGFWRKGNVDMVCQRYGIRQVPNLDALIAAAARTIP